MNNIVKVGVIGCGYWGPNLIRNLQAQANAKVIAVCDNDPYRLQYVKGGYPSVEGYANFEAMLRQADLDAVMIATSLEMHQAMAKSSLLAGKHTFVEKPMAACARECQELIDIARSQNMVLMVGHTFLYSTPVRKIKEIVNSGEIGDIRYISSRRLNLGLYQKDINVTWDLAPHDLSIILYIMDEVPISVNCQGKAHITPGIEDVTAMILNFSQERTAFIQSSWLDPRKVREMTIVGSKKMIVYDDIAPLEKIKIYDMRVERPPHYDTFAEFQYAYHYGDLYVPYVKQEEPLKVECQHFVDCILQGKKPLTNGEHGLDVIRILEASSASLKNNGLAYDLQGNPFSDVA